MGDIIQKLKLCGLTFDGEVLKPIHAPRDWPEVKALVDTGATSSVITRTLAELAGAKIMPNTKTFRGGRLDGAMVAIQVAGCKPSYHHVVVDDELAANAEPHAFMILGHDYLQDNRARIDYANGDLVTCPPRDPAPKKRVSSKATGRNARGKPRGGSGRNARGKPRGGR